MPREMCLKLNIETSQAEDSPVESLHGHFLNNYLLWEEQKLLLNGQLEHNHQEKQQFAQEIRDWLMSYEDRLDLLAAKLVSKKLESENLSLALSSYIIILLASKSNPQSTFWAKNLSAKAAASIA